MGEGGFMASDAVIIRVKPDGPEWHVHIDDTPLLMLQRKDTAVAEAEVQALRMQPSRVVVHGADGEIEDEAAYPTVSTNGTRRAPDSAETA